MKAERINIPEDNSCLFNAIHHLIERETVSELRQIVASIILSHPEVYNQVYLDKNVETYIDDILNPSQWGGAIELQILAQYYQIEIAAFSVESGRALIYGEEECYSKRIYLIYNGIHYDSLVMKNNFKTTKIFSANDQKIYQEFEKLTRACHLKGDYISLSKLITQCQICSKKLPNAVEIQKHAQETGHLDFEEVRE